MKRYYFLFLLISLSSCKKLSSMDCQYTFAREMFTAVEYKECEKEELISDFHAYKEWLNYLISIHELRTGPASVTIPENLKTTKRIFCSRGCSATHVIEGQCFYWEGVQRMNMQRIDRLSRKEPKGCNDKYKAKNLKSDFHIDYDWKNTWKYKNRHNLEKKGKGQDLGEGIWKSL